MIVYCSNCERGLLTEADLIISQHRPTGDYVSCGCVEFEKLDALIAEVLTLRTDLSESYDLALVNADICSEKLRENKELRAQIEAKNKYIQEMVAIAANKRLDGYRELGAKCAELESTNKELRAQLARYNNDLKSIRTSIDHIIHNERGIVLKDVLDEVNMRINKLPKSAALDAEILRCAKELEKDRTGANYPHWGDSGEVYTLLLKITDAVKAREKASM